MKHNTTKQPPHHERCHSTSPAPSVTMPFPPPTTLPTPLPPRGLPLHPPNRLPQTPLRVRPVPPSFTHEPPRRPPSLLLFPAGTTPRASTLCPRTTTPGLTPSHTSRRRLVTRRHPLQLVQQPPPVISQQLGELDPLLRPVLVPPRDMVLRRLEVYQLVP